MYITLAFCALLARWMLDIPCRNSAAWRDDDAELRGDAQEQEGQFGTEH
jgi:hypothetical protein